MWSQGTSHARACFCCFQDILYRKCFQSVIEEGDLLIKTKQIYSEEDCHYPSSQLWEHSVMELENNSAKQA